MHRVKRRRRPQVRNGWLRRLRATSVAAWFAAVPAVVRRNPCRFCNRTGRTLAFPAAR